MWRQKASYAENVSYDDVIMISTERHFVSGDFGGYMGLLIGASAMTAFELLDLFIYNTIRKLRSRKRTKARKVTSVKPI